MIWYIAVPGVIVPIMAATTQHTSSYRMKFEREEFLALIEIAKQEIIYHRGSMRFFAYNGFVMYTFECENSDFDQKIFEVIEFSNYAWSELEQYSLL